MGGAVMAAVCWGLQKSASFRLLLFPSLPLHNNAALIPSLPTGISDAYWEYRLKPWDMAAGVLVAEEAGGTVTTMDGRAFSGATWAWGSRQQRECAGL